MQEPGFTCLADLEPLTIEILRTADGLWNMHLFDRLWSFRVIMPPSEFDLDAAKEKALINAKFYMCKYGGDSEWKPPSSVEWREFRPKSVVWET